MANCITTSSGKYDQDVLINTEISQKIVPQKIVPQKIVPQKIVPPKNCSPKNRSQKIIPQKISPWNWSRNQNWEVTKRNRKQKRQPKSVIIFPFHIKAYLSNEGSRGWHKTLCQPKNNFEIWLKYSTWSLIQKKDRTSSTYSYYLNQYNGSTYSYTFKSEKFKSVKIKNFSKVLGWS